MRSSGESRVVLIGAAVGVVVLLLFTLSLGAVLLVSRTTADRGIVTTPSPPVAIASASASAAAIAGLDTASHASQTIGPASDTSPVPPSSLAGTPQTSTTTAPALLDATVTAVPSTPTAVTPTTAEAPSMTPTQTSAPQPSGTPTPVPPSATTGVASIDWPEFLPDGMAFAAADSWPFRLIGPGQKHEPFLIFRGGPRWLLLRNEVGASQPIPRSATTETRQIAGTSARVIKYFGGGFKVILDRGGRTLQISGEELPDEDISRVIESLRPLSAESLRRRLTQEAAQQRVGVTLLWPDYVPDGFQLEPAETIAASNEAANPDAIDGYRISFKGGDARVQVGGGTVPPPTLTGTEERITAGSLTGILTSSQRRYLLVIEAGAGHDNVVPTFPSDLTGARRPLPLVQKGPVFITAENIDLGQFDRVVAGLTGVQPREWISRARGQRPDTMSYLLPTVLPPGATIDLTTVQTAWDDFVLQGGMPFFVLPVLGPDQATAEIKGGQERTGAPFIVPEGPGVERTVVTIRGRTVSAAQTPDGSVLFWLENNWPYSLTSESLTVTQLAVIGEGLQVVDEDAFFQQVK